jgi:hypothetical protein
LCEFEMEDDGSGSFAVNVNSCARIGLVTELIFLKLKLAKVIEGEIGALGLLEFSAARGACISLCFVGSILPWPGAIGIGRNLTRGFFFLSRWFKEAPGLDSTGAAAEIDETAEGEGPSGDGGAENSEFGEHWTSIGLE